MNCKTNISESLNTTAMLLIYVFRSVCFLFIDLNYSLFRVDSGAAVDSYSDIKKKKTHHCRVRRVMSLDICLKYNSVEAIYFLAHSLFVRENNMSLTLNRIRKRFPDRKLCQISTRCWQISANSSTSGIFVSLLIDHIAV